MFHGHSGTITIIDTRQKPPPSDYWAGVLFRDGVPYIEAHGVDYYDVIDTLHNRNKKGHPFKFVNIRIIGGHDSSLEIYNWISTCCNGDQTKMNVAGPILVDLLNNFITH